MTGIISLVVLIVGLASIIILFGLVARTKAGMKQGFSFLVLGMATFVILEAINVLKTFQIISSHAVPSIMIDIFSVTSILLFFTGFWKLKTLIMNISDFGQVLVITSKANYEDTITSLVKRIGKVCYVTLDKPSKKIVDILDTYLVSRSSVEFIDASEFPCNVENCFSIKNTPDDIKIALERVLKEKNPSCIVVDDISALKNIEKFEVPKFVQDVSLLVKANGSRGFFIGINENISKETINDITMFVDKVMGDNR